MPVKRKAAPPNHEQTSLIPQPAVVAVQSAPARRRLPGLKFERAAWRLGMLQVAGVDEVGRGALAGPVVAAAVLLDPKKVPRGIDDSKRLTPRRREELAARIRDTAICWGVGQIESDEIDRINILRASLAAMRIAAEGLSIEIDHLLVDGNMQIPGWPRSQATLIGGDGLSASIAAASIVAKVTRDKLMRDYESEWPGYGFGIHVGYGTRAHREAIDRLGPCPLHRRTFHGVETLDLFASLEVEGD